MNIIYVSCTCSKEKIIELFRYSKQIPGQQVQKYHRLLMEGMVLNCVNVKTVTAKSLTHLNYSKKVTKNDNDKVSGVKYRATYTFEIMKLK